MGSSCPGGVGSVKCVICTATAGGRRGTGREDGSDGRNVILHYCTDRVCWGEGKKIVSWGKGDERGFCFSWQRMSFSPGVPLMLPVLKINGKTDRTADTLCCLRALGSATQGLILSSELPGMVAVFLVGAKSCRNQWCHSLTQLPG